MNSSTSTRIEDLGLAAPALRALKGAGYSHLAQLAQARVSDLTSLHGCGPKSIRQLGEALAARGLSFARETDQGPSL